MRISELGRATGVAVPTIKYYLREGLLPPGRSTAPNQAQYGDRHAHRLRLIRALVDVGGLSIQQVRDVLDAIADPRLELHDLLGIAHHALGPDADPSAPLADVQQARAEVDRFLHELGWQVSPSAPARAALADALAALRRLGRDISADAFRFHADIADRLAQEEVARIPIGADRSDAVERVVVGTVVFEAVLIALRRLAQEHHSSRRFRA